MPEPTLKKVRKKKKITFRRLKNWVLSLVGLTVILMAISFTLIRVAIKSIPDYSIAIQQAISEQMEMTLEVGFIDAEIYWLVPRLNLIDVNISDATGKQHLLHLDEIDLSMDWSESLQTFSPVIGEVTLTGLNIELGIDKKSQLMIQDYVVNERVPESLDVSEQINSAEKLEISDALKYNFNHLNFKIINSKVRFYDERHESRSKTLNNFNLHLINSGDSHVFEVKADLPHKYGRYAHIIIEVEGDLFDYKNLDGELYLALENINAASWLDDYWNELNVTANADISGRIWLEWSGVDIIDVNSRLKLSDLAVHYLDDEIETWNINEIDVLLRWRKENQDWQLDVRDLIVDREGIDWLQPASATLKTLNNVQEVHFQADFLRIEGFVYLAGMLNSVTEKSIAWLSLLENYRPAGELQNLDVKIPLYNPQDIEINTRFSQLGFSLPGTEPAEIKNLQGSIEYLDKKTWLTLDSSNTEIKFNTLFRNAIFLKQLKGTLELSHQNKIWVMSSPSLVIDTPHLQSEMRVNFNMPDNGRAFLDLTSHYKNGDATALSRYLPAGVMGEDTVEWIDRAIHSGNVISGGYLFYGYLDDAPFRGSQGVSLADFDVSGIDLTYLENWPDVKGVSANLRFENDEMKIVAHHAHMLNSEIKETYVYIDNFISPTLDIKGKMDVQLSDIKKYINESGLRDEVTDYINNLQFSGKGELSLELFLPLYGDYYTEVGGQLLIENGSMLFEKEAYQLNNIDGLIRFAGDTVESSNLTAELSGGIAGQQLGIDIKTKNIQDDRLYNIDVNGTVLASALLASIETLQPYIEGDANLNMHVEILNNKTLKQTSIKAHIASDLQGVTISLPGPLAKAEQAAAPINMDINVQPGDDVEYELTLNNGDLLTLNQSAEKILINASTQSVTGNISLNMRKDIDEPVKINLEMLDLNKFFKIDKKNGHSEQSKIKDMPQRGIYPRDIPSFDFYADKLIWKKTTYEKTRISVQNSVLGLAINHYKLTGTNHTITGKGSWFTGRNNIDTTKLDVNIEVSDLGNVFKSLEISDGLVDTSGNVNLRWQWQGAPYDFSWKSVQGDGELSLKDGKLKELNAGAGRLLGLLNFETLLSLDFGNQVGRGFNFDKVNGSFSFVNENIYSDDFEIESKIADIHMDGMLSIANNDIKQTVTVRPHVGATVTLGTAVVAGPAIGGLVYLFQKIFNTDRLAEYQYTMSGSIDEPQVKLISAPIAERDDDNEF